MGRWIPVFFSYPRHFHVPAWIIEQGGTPNAIHIYVGSFQSVLPPGWAAVRWLFGHSSPSIDLLVRDSPNDSPSVPHCLNDKAYDIQEKADSRQHT